MSLGISASTVKSWFQYRCERKTRYELMNPGDRAAIPIVEEMRDKPWAEFGQDFERRVVARLARQTRVLLPPAGESGLLERQALPFLRGATDFAYAAQVNLKPRTRPAFLESAPMVEVRRTYADLVRCDGSGDAPVFRVIDIKATRVATAFHKAQAAFYARMLESVLSDLGLGGRVDPTGSVWRIPDDGDAEGDAWQEEDFALGPYLRLVDDFCRRTLLDIEKKKVSPGHDDSFFHVYFKCEQCSYLPHCEKAIAPSLPAWRRDISAVPGMSHEAKRTLLGVGIDTVEKLANAPGVRQLDGAGWSLSRRAEALVGRAAALRDNAVRRASEPHSFLMPPRADVAFYLLADHDPVDDTLVTLGYAKVRDGQETEVIEVLPSASRQLEADALVRVFGRLIADLEEIDRINQDGDETTSLYSHIFLYEPSEAVNLQNAIRRHLDDPRIRNGLLHMVRLFPPEEVVPEPEFRGVHHLPATAVRSVVEQLYALPVTVSYDLRQVSGALQAARAIPVAYQPEPPFRRPFSSLLSIDVSRELRKRQRGNANVEAVKADVRSRLRATRAIVEWLQTEHRKSMASDGRPMLRLAKKPFRLHATFDPLEIGDLDLLRALELLENRSGLLDALIRLAQPLRARRDTGRCYADLHLVGNRRRGRDYILTFDAPRESREAELGPETLGLILTDDDPDLRLNPGMWNSVACSLEPPRPQDRPGILHVRVYATVFEGEVFQSMLRRTGDRGWCLDESFVDFNSQKVANFISFLAQGGGDVGS